jgi:hypothetical protein
MFGTDERGHPVLEDTRSIKKRLVDVRLELSKIEDLLGKL